MVFLSSQQLTMYRVSYVVLFYLAINVCIGCLLCPLRLPPRPRPIDHFLLPSVENLELPESVAALCNATTNLPVSYKCGKQISRIVCAISNFTDAYRTTCNILEPYNICAECFQRKARITSENFWSISWLDSLGKMPSAISEGNYYWFGDYEQCVKLKTSKAFDGRYCQVLLEIPDATIFPSCLQEDPLEIHFGFCAPTACSASELDQFLQSYSQYKLKVQCEASPQWPISSEITLSLIVIWITIVIAGTLIDVNNDKVLQNSQLIKLAKCVSIRLNGHRCLSTKRSHKYHSIQGVQVLSTSIIVTANCYLIMMPYIENVLFSYENVKIFLMHPLNNFTFHIDALITANSLFLSLTLVRTLRNMLAIKKQFFKRFMQILPPYAFFIIFMTFIFERMSSGPMWKHSDLLNRCSKHWWKNLFFINNLFGATDTCIDGGYLISLEAQFFILLTALIYFSLRSSRYAIMIACLATFASIIYTFCIVATKGLPPTIVLTVDPLPQTSMATFVNDVYIKPWTRAPAFLIGFLFSFLFTKQDKINKMISAGLQAILTMVALFIVYALYSYTVEAPLKSTFLSLYAALHRPAWSIIICLIVYLCYRKSAGEFGDFLEWRLFAPLAKQSYVVFLVSEAAFLYLFSSLHRPFHATHWSTLYMALGTLILSYIIAFVLDIFVTRPIRNLIRREPSIFDKDSMSTEDNKSVAVRLIMTTENSNGDSGTEEKS